MDKVLHKSKHMQGPTQIQSADIITQETMWTCTHMHKPSLNGMVMCCISNGRESMQDTYGRAFVWAQMRKIMTICKGYHGKYTDIQGHGPTHKYAAWKRDFSHTFPHTGERRIVSHVSGTAMRDWWLALQCYMPPRARGCLNGASSSSFRRQWYRRDECHSGTI